MRLSLISFIGLIAINAQFTRADEIEDALQKFCGGIKVTGPTQGQQFTDPTKVVVVVEREPNAEAKVINGVDIYSIDSNGTPKYLGTPSKEIYNLNTRAQMTVDITKIQGIQLPSQFEFRVWVHNEAGPDCTLMSQVFQVASATHSNDVSTGFQSLSVDIDRGCFGVDLVKPKLGEHVQAKRVAIQIKKDPSSQVTNYESLDLYKVHIDSRKTELVQKSWVGQQRARELFTIKDTIQKPDASANSNDTLSDYAYFYRLKGLTQNKESCTFTSHPFYINGHSP
ncbi:hypothetical protein BX666DRAFT_319206 [Dichotomocladium elegans]|nr:hypothetical protein BX666DRAFT_319206 [Dichotomocladium elegans]